MRDVPYILYFVRNLHDAVHVAALAGVRRYASARGWDVEVFLWKEALADGFPSIWASQTPPLGCVVECSDLSADLPLRVYGKAPAVFLNCPETPHGQRFARMDLDDNAVARTAFRELSASHPPAFGIVGFRLGPRHWSDMGDHSAFTGDYYIQGHARIAPAIFSPLAGIKLADGTDGIGVIETAGTFTRPVGTGKGELCWKRFSAYPSSYALRGGFAANGGDLTVNLGGEGAKLSPGSDYLPNGAVIQLQSQYADGDLTFATGFELGGKTQAVNVWSGKTATLAGAVSDEVGGGKLDVTGNLVFAGTIEVGAANVASASPLVTVDGDLSFEDGATVRVDPAAFANDAMVPYETDGLPLATATGTITGLPALADSGIPDGWYLAKRNGTLVLKRKQAFLLILR